MQKVFNLTTLKCNTQKKSFYADTGDQDLDKQY